MGYCQPWLDNFIPAVLFHHLPHMWIYTEQAQAAQCPDGTTDFSYDWTGLDGQFPSGGPLTLMAGIAPNLDLDAWQKSAGCNLCGLGFIRRKCDGFANCSFELAESGVPKCNVFPKLGHIFCTTPKSTGGQVMFKFRNMVLDVLSAE